jgi:serine protease Do
MDPLSPFPSPSPARRVRSIGLWALGVFLTSSLGLTGFFLTTVDSPGAALAAVNAPAAQAESPIVSPAGFTEVAKAVKPAIVNITPSKIERTRGSKPTLSPEDFFGFPWPRQFEHRRHRGDRGDRGDQGEMEPRHGGMGSGVIISPDGYILTNNHVVEGGKEFTIALPDKREFKGSRIGSDPKSDLAVLKIDAQDLPYVRWGDSSKLQVGEYVLAVGNPFGLNSTVTLGIVSALGRGRMGITQYEDFIQTDAAINPGNSGGALVNTRGELVGINTAIFSHSGGNQGIGFAVPTSMVKPVYDSLVKTGKVVRGYLGVRIQDLTADLAKSFGLKQSASGVIVSDVSEDSPAESAGLRSGDVVVGYQGTPVEDSAALQRLVSATAVGTTVKMTVMREGKELQVLVKIAEQPDTVKVARAAQDATEHALTGVEVASINDRTAHEFGLAPKKSSGVVVVDVEPGSPADRAGVAQGDVIREINRRPVRSTTDYEKITTELKKDQDVLLLIHRQGASLFLSVRV